MYFMKQGGPLALVDCRYHAPTDSVYVGWTAYPQPWLRCYQQNFTLTGRPYVVGSRHPQCTVSLAGFAGSEPPFLGISRHEATLLSGRDTLHLSATAPVSWRVQPGFEGLVALAVDSSGLAVVTPTNHTDETAAFCVEALAADGRQAACCVTVQPAQLPPPSFVRRPRLVRRGSLLRLDYELRLEGRRDESLVTWYRDDTPVATSHGGSPEREYRLTAADRYHLIRATIAPRHQRSDYGPQASASYKVKRAPADRVLATDFHDFPCDWQPRVMEAYWTVDGYKPLDTAEFDWSFDRSRPMWTYGEGFNGAVGQGLLQAQRGARLMYTPLAGRYGDMALTLQVDPTKTAGQGFGSATGQYMDVCLKFDTRTLTGYALRIVRTVKHAKAVDFLLVEYQNGAVRPLTEPVSSTCYRTGCTISLRAQGGTLSAHVETTTPRPDGSQLPHSVDLSCPMKPSDFGGVAIQHTGSCGESTTMLHRLEVKLSR